MYIDPKFTLEFINQFIDFFLAILLFVFFLSCYFFSWSLPKSQATFFIFNERIINLSVEGKRRRWEEK